MLIYKKYHQKTNHLEEGMNVGRGINGIEAVSKDMLRMMDADLNPSRSIASLSRRVGGSRRSAERNGR